MKKKIIIHHIGQCKHKTFFGMVNGHCIKCGKAYKNCEVCYTKGGEAVMDSEKAQEFRAVEYMEMALGHLKGVQASRENSLAITKLEEALMWCNKDRTIKGQLEPNPTHRRQIAFCPKPSGLGEKIMKTLKEIIGLIVAIALLVAFIVVAFVELAVRGFLR